MNSVFLIVVVAYLLECTRYAEAIECYSCTNHDKDCLADPKRLQTCDVRVTDCYIYVKDENYRFFERGCGNDRVVQYQNCKKGKNNPKIGELCFVCTGHRCNPMAIQSKPSQQYCISCYGEEDCKKNFRGKLCQVDSLFGPQHCQSTFNNAGTRIVSRGCLSDIPVRDNRIPLGQLVPCSGLMCNYGNSKMFQRCISFWGNVENFELKKSTVDCFVPGQHISDIPGCYVRRGEGRYHMWHRFGCNSELNLTEYNRCQERHVKCNVCVGDMCNDIKIPTYLKVCFTVKNEKDHCGSFDTPCFRYDDGTTVVSGCMTDLVPALYTPLTLICNNEHEYNRKFEPCLPQKHTAPVIGCYSCFGHTCDDVLVTEGYMAKVVCPLGTTECYSARRTDGLTFRGCLEGTSEGVRVCRNSLGNCRRCSSNYCNYQKVVPLFGMCYKTNWDIIDVHEATLRLADCTGVTFRGQVHHCYIASSARLFMRMGCITEMSGIDDSWQITQGDTSVVWLYRNACYKCVSNWEGFCFDTTYLKPEKCTGLNKYPARGCYIIKDKRAKRLERGCITELNEYMLRMCDIPFFYYLCNVCTGDGCNDDRFDGFD